MKIFSTLFVLSLFIAPSAFAVAMAKPAISITDAYAFAVPDGAKVGAAFMTITYGAATGADVVPDRIMHVSTPAAGKSELHTMTLDNNVMTMRPVDSFPLPPTGSFALKPDGVHVMLMDLKRTLKAGDQFPLVITFAKAGEVKVDVKVRAPGDVTGDVAEPEEEKAVHEDMKMDDKMDHGMHH